MCARATQEGVQRSAGPTSGAHDGDDTFQAGGRQGRPVLLKKQERSFGKERPVSQVQGRRPGLGGEVELSALQWRTLRGCGWRTGWRGENRGTGGRGEASAQWPRSSEAPEST